MAINLTDASIVSRKGIRIAIIGLIIIIILRFVFMAGVSVFKKVFPPAAPPPTVLFEKLPPLPFLNFDVDKLKNTKFTLETVDGKLTLMPEQAYVYFMPKTPSSILSLDKAKDTAGRLGFTDGSRELVETVYEFSHPTRPSKMSMNIINGVFSISYDLNSDPNILTEIPPTVNIASSNATDFLGKANILPEDLTGPATHQFLRIEGGKFVEALSLSDADLTKVNLFRKEYNEIPAVTPLYDEANVWFIFGGQDGRDAKIVAGEYHYYPIDEKNSSTYPIITSQKAWEMLQSGNAYVAKFGDNSDQVIIRNVYLAYYDSGQYSQFYQPVIVFEGDNDFVAYVPAVTEQYYTQK